MVLYYAQDREYGKMVVADSKKKLINFAKKMGINISTIFKSKYGVDVF